MLFQFAKISPWDSDVFSPLKAASVFVELCEKWCLVNENTLCWGSGYGSALLNYSLFLWNAQDLQHSPLWQENTKYREFSVCNLAVTCFVSAFSVETN